MFDKRGKERARKSVMPESHQPNRKETCIDKCKTSNPNIYTMKSSKRLEVE
jgi:hypothetical protein